MKTRNYNLDLLRYIAMFFVVFEHTCSHWFGKDTKIIESIAGAFFLTFPLISGYYSNCKINVYKMITYALELLFYSVIISLIFNQFDMSYASPLTSGIWWYASAYFMVMIFMPLLKTLPDKMTCILSIIGGFICLSIMPVLTYSAPFEVGDGMSFIFIFYMTYLGRVLREIKDPSRQISVLGFIFCILMTFLLNQTAYYNINSPYVVLASVFLFYTFKSFSFKRKISSKYAWPIYLIHCHPVIWKMFEGSTYGFSFGKCFIYALVIFVVCFILSIPFTLLLSLLDKKVKQIPKITPKESVVK